MVKVKGGWIYLGVFMIGRIRFSGSVYLGVISF